VPMEYRHDSTWHAVLRFDSDKEIYEGYNWKEKKWQKSDNAYAAAWGRYDGYLDKITEQQADDIIKQRLNLKINRG